MNTHDRGYEGERVVKRHLPRLAPGFYRGHAFVHWTFTTKDRSTGWLTPNFYSSWQLALVHTCARYDLVCPVYVVMPDHIHLVLLGCNEDGPDQRTAVEFLRKHSQAALMPFAWQHQAHDHVLRDNEREHGAFQTVAHYILENPVRANLASDWRTYPYIGCCVPGYPTLNPMSADFWPLFWRIYNKFVDSQSPTRSRS